MSSATSNTYTESSLTTGVIVFVTIFILIIVGVLMYFLISKKKTPNTIPNIQGTNVQPQTNINPFNVGRPRNAPLT
jgi:flagellar basal body-associated protein FliL